MKITVAEDGIALDSPEEALFYGLCRFHGIPVERVGRSRAQDVSGSGWYCPDFYLPGLDAWVEVVSGNAEEGTRAQRTGWRMPSRRLAVLYRDELHVLMTRANSHVVQEQLKIWAR